MEKFVEFQNWGFNALIISFFMTIIFSIFQGYGFVVQSRKIFKEESVESISLVMFFYLFFYLMAFAVYGLEEKSLAIIFKGLIFIFVAPIIVGIFKFKDKITLKDICLFILTMTVVPAMIILKNKDGLLLFLLTIGLVAIFFQLITIVKNKSTGVLEIKLIYICLTTNIFWLIYAVGIKNFPLIFSNCIAIFFYASIIGLYKKYKVKK